MSIRIFGPNAAFQATKLCRNCVYFRPNPTYIKKDKTQTQDADSIALGLCAISGVQDLVTGEIRSSYASVQRSNSAECGPDGKYFSEAPPPNAAAP